MKLFICLAILALAGCSPYIVNDYVHDESKTHSRVSFEMLGANAHAQSMRLSLLNLPGCEQKPTLSNLGSLINTIFVDRQNIELRLPSNEVLNLHYSNSMESMALRMECEWLGSYILLEDHEYLLQGTNITPKSDGCEVEFMGRKIGEDNYAKIASVEPNLPYCESNN